LGRKTGAFTELLKEAFEGEGYESIYNTNIKTSKMTIRPFFWDVISLLQVSLIDIRTSFPQGSVQSDLNQALIISSLRAYSAYLSESRSSLKELLFEYDTLVSIFLTRFEYSTVVELEAAQFHSEIYKLLVNA
jgi:hypothetical protein